MNPAICKKVVTIGPHYKEHGGIASVISCYKEMFDPFRFVPTTRQGMLTKIAMCIGGMFKLAWYRLTGSRVAHVHVAARISFWRKAVFVQEAKLLGMKVVLHVHSGHFSDFATAHRALVTYVLKRCDVVIALSQYWKDYISSEFGMRNVEIVNNVIPDPDRRKTNKDLRLTLLFLGSIIPDKGVFDLLECLSRNAGKFQDKVRLYIGGVGEVGRLQSDIRDKGIADMVDFIGWVSGEEKAGILNKSDIFILPSYAEGLPISILEAMSYGMPVISTTVGGIPEIVKDDNGILIRPGDIDAMGVAISYFLDNPDAVASFRNVSLDRSRSYLPDAVGRQLSAVYGRLTK